MTKRDYIRSVFAIWLKMSGVAYDDVDVFTRGGHWYGQLRTFHSYNHFDTKHMSEWSLTFTNQGIFTAKKIKDYDN